MKPTSILFFLRGSMGSCLQRYFMQSFFLKMNQVATEFLVVYTGTFVLDRENLVYASPVAAKRYNNKESNSPYAPMKNSQVASGASELCTPSGALSCPPS